MANGWTGWYQLSLAPVSSSCIVEWSWSAKFLGMLTDFYSWSLSLDSKLMFDVTFHPHIHFDFHSQFSSTVKEWHLWLFYEAYILRIELEWQSIWRWGWKVPTSIRMNGSFWWQLLSKKKKDLHLNTDTSRVSIDGKWLNCFVSKDAHDCRCTFFFNNLNETFLQ